MTLIVLASASGAPGVTTTAVGLARCWPGDTLLVEADRQPSQSVQAGFLNGAPAGGRGLTGLARAHRERRFLADEIPRHCVPLGPEADHRRLFLPGFAHPGSAGLFVPIWPDLTQGLERFRASGFTVIVDAGRIGDGLPGPLLAAADVVLVVTRTHLRALAGVRLHLPVVSERLAALATGTELGLLLIGEGQPYSGAEISRQFGLAVWGTLPERPKHAAVWSDGAPSPARFDRSPLVQGIRATIATLRTGNTPSADRQEVTR